MNTYRIGIIIIAIGSTTGRVGILCRRLDLGLLRRLCHGVPLVISGASSSGDLMLVLVTATNAAPLTAVDARRLMLGGHGSRHLIVYAASAAERLR